MNKVIHGDCLNILTILDDNSVDSIVTDPPYELGFMNKKWDASGIAYNVELWKECLRVLKPGGHLLSFGGSRTYHRMACAIEDAGFEIRDQIQWIYGSGFPKSQNIGKAIDKHGGKSVSWFGEWLRNWRAENGITQKEIAKLFPSKTGNMTGCVANWELGFNLPTAEQFTKICRTFDLPFDDIEEAEREVVGQTITNKTVYQRIGDTNISGEIDITTPATPEAQKWEGWGSALKPAHEPIALARKPLSEKTIAANVLKWGTGGINIDGCRVEGKKGVPASLSNASQHGWRTGGDMDRFPANVIHDGSDEVLRLFPCTTVGARRKGQLRHTKDGDINFTGDTYTTNDYPASSGSAARFFYCAKASKAERNMGCEGLDAVIKNDGRGQELASGDVPMNRSNNAKKNHHPTVKPLALMRYLCRLITPPDGIVLDPFAGSGSTLIAAKQEGFNFIGIEMEEEYIKIAECRLQAVTDEQLSIV